MAGGGMTLSAISAQGLNVSALIARANAANAVLARNDPNRFTQFVMRDEETGKPLLQSRMHQEWQHEASAHSRLVLLAHIESGKTQQLSIARPMFELGNDTTTRCVVVSATKENAIKITRTIQHYISDSEELRMVFPGLKPGRPWTPAGFNIAGREHAKDYSFQAIGVGGHILGARIDLLILDDILDWTSTRTAYQRDKVYDWVFSTLFGRLTRRARVIAVGNPWHPDDLLHKLGARGWAFRRYPVMDTEGRSRWPKRWPMERIQQWEHDYGPSEFARQLMCQARSDTDSRFKREWIEASMAKAHEMGIRNFVHRMDPKPGFATFTGVDLAVQQTSGANLTVLFTICVDPQGNRQVLEIQSGRWASPEIIQRVHDVHQRFKSVVFVEDNAAQAYLVQFLNGTSAIPVRPFRTGMNKLNPALGVESLAAEMATGKWLIPNDGGTLHPEVSAWIDDMLYYHPDAHTGDRLMASWIAREGARTGLQKVEFGRVDLLRR